MLQAPYLSRKDIHRVIACAFAFPGENGRLLLLIFTCCHMQDAPTAPNKALKGSLATSDTMTNWFPMSPSEGSQYTTPRPSRPS